MRHQVFIFLFLISFGIWHANAEGEGYVFMYNGFRFHGTGGNDNDPSRGVASLLPDDSYNSNFAGKHVEIPEVVIYEPGLYHFHYWVTDISNNALSYCKMTSVTIPGGVKSIGEYAFDHCTGLTSIDLPPSLNSLGSYAFSGCTGLTHVNIPRITSIGDYAFYYCTGLQSVNISYGLERIGSNMFYSCYNLNSLTISASVNRIGFRAFLGCYKLKKIVSYIADPNNVIYATSNGNAPTFQSVDKNNCKLYVPLESINLYKNHEQWKEFINIYPIVSSITLNKNNLSMAIGNTETLSATVLPEGADALFSWASNDPSIATVDQNGKVTAKGLGSTTIVVTSNDGAASASCNVTVYETEVEDFETMPTTTSTSAQNVYGHWSYWSFTNCNVTAPGNQMCNGTQAVAMMLPSNIESDDTYYDAYQLSVNVFNQTNNDAKLKLSYSVDGGSTWNVAKSETGETSITISKNSTATPTWVLSTSKTVPTRYRIQQIAGNENNPIYIDNITIFYTAKGTPPPIIEDFETMPATTSTSAQYVEGRWAFWSFTNSNVAEPGSGLCDGNRSVAMNLPCLIESSDTYCDAYQLSVKAFNKTSTDAKLTLSYSVDGGTTWNVAKSESGATSITVGKNTTATPTWALSTSKTVPTRYRIQQIAGNKNSPIYIDNITICYTAKGAPPQSLEDFEVMPTTTSTSAQNVQGRWANWSFTKCNVVAPGSGMCNGTQAVAMKLPSQIECSDTYYDTYLFTAKVFNTTSTDAKLTLSYSVDGGNTWKVANSATGASSIVISKNSTAKPLWLISASKRKPTRYRVQQIAGNKNNPIYIDDITLYYTAMGSPDEGDVNGDGKVNVSDVTALINMILGGIPKDMERADVNGDGIINVSDVTALVNIILGVV